jgi:integrase/recombinase XerC
LYICTVNGSTNIIAEHSKDDLLKYNTPNLHTLSIDIFGGLDLSKGTVTDYRYRIGRFIKYLNTNGLDLSVYLNYKRHLHSLPCSVSTQNKYLISAKIFLRELYRLGYLERDLTVNVRGFKQNHSHKKDGLTEADINRIQEHCQSLKHNYHTLRLKALLSLLIYQGLRQVEICRLNVEDINLSNRLAFIQGKGRDDKEIIWLHPYTIIALKDYLKGEKLVKGPLFLNKSNFRTGERLTTKSIRGILDDLHDFLGINGTTHGYRHYFATKLIKAYKGELLTVSKYTRHRSIQMLEIYNDEVLRQEDLPRFYEVFDNIKI